MADHLRKAWECAETLENSLPSRGCCAEADRAVYLCVQDPLACVAQDPWASVTSALEVTHPHTFRIKTQKHVCSFSSPCPLNASSLFSVFRGLRYSFKNMAWKNGKHIHTWHHADAHLDLENASEESIL